MSILALDTLWRPLLELCDEVNRLQVDDKQKLLPFSKIDPPVTVGDLRRLVHEWMRERMVAVQVAEDAR